MVSPAAKWYENKLPHLCPASVAAQWPISVFSKRSVILHPSFWLVTFNPPPKRKLLYGAPSVKLN